MNFRGKSGAERDAALLAFVERVYGPYLPAHRDEIRDHISKVDPKLFTALRNYGFGRLPKHLKMNSRDDRLRERIKRAATDYDNMEPRERRSVQRVARARNQGPK